MRKLRILTIAAMGLAAILSAATFSQAQNRPAKKPLVREILVPYSELDKLLESQARRVYMTRKEYRELLKEAVKQAPHEPPHGAAILKADYNIALGDGRATIDASLDIDVLRSKQVAIQLPISGAGVRQATLDDQSAPLARHAKGATLFVNGTGIHKLKMQLTSAVETEAAQQTIELELPRGAASTIAMSVPGNVEVKSGAEVISRKVDSDANITHFQLVAWTGKRRITMSLNNRRFREDRSVVCRSVIVDELTEAYERLHITSSFEVLHGAIDRLRFAAPARLGDLGSAFRAPRALAGQNRRQPTDC